VSRPAFLASADRRHLERELLGVVVALFAAFAVAYTRITPIGASPDELSHLHYINGIADHLRLPPAGEPERQQPPLYYLLGAIVAKLTGDDARLIRLLSVVLGVLTILTVYAVARRLFPLRPVLAVGAAALVGLLPEAQYLAGAVNDDNLAWLAGALLVLAGVVVMQSDLLTPRLAIGVGLAVALAVLAKETVWALAVLLLVVVALRFARQMRALQIAALLLPAIVLAGWWFVRNAVVFGSPLPPLHPITAQRQVFDSISILGLRPLPSTLAVAGFAVITIAACVAVARSWERWDRRRRGVAIFLLGVLVVAAVQSVLNSATFDLQPQARYLLVAVAAAAPITAWTIAWRRRGPLPAMRGWAIAALIAVALLLDVSGLITAAHTVA
jgi:4-amino-4-deoxy-L-arabinose transferase-like glycosyltransferase